MANVQLKNLVKTYAQGKGNGIQVVHGIDLEIRDGEFMVLVGPSGCGKSTTLRMIAGLEEISGGEISIAGQVVNHVPPKDRDIAMVFQNYALYPHMTVRDNMGFGLKLRKFPRAQIEQRVREAAAMLGLEEFLDRKPKALSGGQRQRVAVGRAIVRHPKVFLFDEPLSNLDAKMRVTTRADLSKLHARLCATMIYVTHDQVEAMTMGDRICVMNEGRIMQVAEPLEIYQHPANLFVAGFIGSPPMNLIRGSIANSANGLIFVEDNPGGAPLRIRLDEALARAGANHVGKPVVFGIRPENLRNQDAATGDEDSATIEAGVEFAEPLGAETMLHLQTGAHAFVARVAPTARYGAGGKISLVADLAQAHLFDGTMEGRL